MSKDAISRAVAIGAVLALGAAPAALAERPADPGSQGKGHEHGHASEHSKAGGKAVVMYVFKGTYLGDSQVDVTKGNAHVKKAGLTGTVSFDLSSAKIVVDDNDNSGTRDLADVNTDDKVVVKARLPRIDPGDQPFTAKQLVDQTHSGSGDGTEAPESPES